MTATAGANLPGCDGELEMFEYPHDVIAHHMRHCEANLEFRLLTNQFGRLSDGVFIARQSPPEIHRSAVFDVTSGPIIFDSGVKVGPHCFFRGPVYVGPNSKISEHSSLKDAVTVAHTCKIGGEVEGCIIQPWTNKQHYGFLGHSYLGSWINLGAGTCNSDLKNTYGTINMRYGDQKIATGMQFVGCFIGDYAKTAINTSIFTGKTIGVASMVYGMATANVPSFVNHAGTLGQAAQMGLLPPEIAITTQQRMYQRRNVPHQDIDGQLIHDMFLQTEHERPSGLNSQPITF
jgi:glucose-1-phosphate thymidylyltransferase